jgi:diguanylate cyclase (GGDEF)-like protein
MPETNHDMAMIAAENLRRCVGELEIQVKNEIIMVSISMGLSSYDPSNSTMDKESTILMADNALLQAKRSGRNRVTPHKEMKI